MASFHVSSHLPVHHRSSLRSISSITENFWTLYLCFLSWSLTMSAPISRTSDGYWVNPCGLEPVEVDSVPPPTSSDDLLDSFKDVSRNAIASHQQISQVKENLLSTANLAEEEIAWYTYDWLPVPAGNDVHYFRRLNREEAMKDAFRMLQMYAVAFEQIINDYERKTDEDIFLTLAEEMRTRSVQLLCTMQIAMVGLKVAPVDPPTRNVMPEEYKNLAYSKQLIRNLIIVREYVKVTFYVKELFKYFISNMEN